MPVRLGRNTAQLPVGRGIRVGVPAGGLLAGWVARLRSRQAGTVVPAAQPPTRPEQVRGQGASSQWSKGVNYFGTRVVVRGPWRLEIGTQQFSFSLRCAGLWSHPSQPKELPQLHGDLP